jgi:hypothetical protein
MNQDLIIFQFHQPQNEKKMLKKILKPGSYTFDENRNIQQIHRKNVDNLNFSIQFVGDIRVKPRGKYPRIILAIQCIMLCIFWFVKKV